MGSVEPADRPGQPTDPTDAPTDAIIDITDPAIASFERIIDLRTPGAPYTYPSSPASRSDDDGSDGGAAPKPRPSDLGLFGVARGSADVRTAPPDY